MLRPIMVGKQTGRNKDMAAEYNVQAIMDDLRKIGDLNPDQHDGSYELMNETIQAYSEMSDYSPLDYRDLNLVYLTTVGTWKQSISSKKKTIDDSHCHLKPNNG